MKFQMVVPTALAFLVMTVSAIAEAPTAPTVVGEWEGTWGGNMTHPMRLTVTQQKDGKVSGTVVFRDGTAGVAVHGTIQVSGGKTTLVIYTQRFEFTVHEDKLDGYGRGPRHEGPAVLTRRSPVTGTVSGRPQQPLDLLQRERR
jgi:hypothetical protein